MRAQEVHGLKNLPLPFPELYDLSKDPEESYDRANEFPDAVAQIYARIEALLPTFPQEVQASWRGTKSRRVYQTPAGSLPQDVPD